MEKLCKLRPLHSGLSPAVLRHLQWPEISEAAHCLCWRTMLTELKPGHRAMIYNAVQEVKELLSLFSTSHITFLIFLSFLEMCCCHMLSVLTRFATDFYIYIFFWQFIHLNILIIKPPDKHFLPLLAIVCLSSLTSVMAS